MIVSGHPVIDRIMADTPDELSLAEIGRRLGVSRALGRTNVNVRDRAVAVEIHLGAAQRRDEWITSAPPSGSVPGRR